MINCNISPRLSRIQVSSATYAVIKHVGIIVGYVDVGMVCTACKVRLAIDYISIIDAKGRTYCKVKTAWG